MVASEYPLASADVYYSAASVSAAPFSPHCRKRSGLRPLGGALEMAARISSSAFGSRQIDSGCCAAGRRIRRGAVGRLVAVDDSGANVGPELVVHFRASADEACGEAEARVVRLVDRSVEILPSDDLQHRSENLLVRPVADVGHVDQ